MKTRFIVFSLLLPLLVIAQESIVPCPTEGYRNNCRGEHTFQNGAKYSGEWKNGRPNGFGELINPSGVKWVGIFSNEGRSLEGTLYWPNGAKHVGEFLQGKPHGKGTQYKPDGTVNASGNWIDGKLDNGQSQAITPSVSTQSSSEAQKWADARRMCMNYGFTPNSNPFAECVQREVHKESSAASRAAEDNNRRSACEQRNRSIVSRAQECKRNCNMSNLQALSSSRANINQLLIIQNQNDACESQCDQQLSMQGAC